MTPAVLERPVLLFGDRAAGDGRATVAEPLGGGRVTLEERLNSVLHALRTNGSTGCPVCNARMTPSPTLTSAGGAPNGAGCDGCGSRLS